NQLRKSHKEKIESMVGFINNKELCSDIFLAKYFGENNIAPCGKCDICIAKKQNIKNENWFRNTIKPLLYSHKKLSINELNTYIGNIKEEEIIYYLRNLNNDGLCTIDFANSMIFFPRKPS